VGAGLAGLILAPLAASHGYRAALFVAIALGIVTAIGIIPFGRALAVPGQIQQRSLSQTIIAPLSLLFHNAPLRPLAGLAFGFASAQWITASMVVAYLVSRIGLTLPMAGIAFAVLQICGTFGRIGSGWIADRSRNVSFNLAVQALAAALSMVLLATLPYHAPLSLILPEMAFAGLSAFGWNGVYLAQVARLALPGAIAETTTGAVSIIYLGNVIAPICGGLIVSFTGSWHLAFLFAGLVPFVFVVAMSLGLVTKSRSGA
ncbi:MAG TPA: MFS transporter, partial [Acidiphilium sp.]